MMLINQLIFLFYLYPKDLTAHPIQILKDQKKFRKKAKKLKIL